jgi:hypothetical protein
MPVTSVQGFADRQDVVSGGLDVERVEQRGYHSHARAAGLNCLPCSQHRFSSTATLPPMGRPVCVHQNIPTAANYPDLQQCPKLGRGRQTDYSWSLSTSLLASIQQTPTCIGSGDAADGDNRNRDSIADGAQRFQADCLRLLRAGGEHCMAETWHHNLRRHEHCARWSLTGATGAACQGGRRMTDCVLIVCCFGKTGAAAMSERLAACQNLHLHRRPGSRRRRRRPRPPAPAS